MRGLRQGLALAACAVSAWAAAPAAAQERDGYLGVDFIGAYTLIDDTAVDGLAGTRSAVEEEDIVVGGGLQIGRRFAPWRAEIDYAWRYRFDYNSDVTTPGAVHRFKDDVRTQSLMLNVLHDFDNGSRWTPYLGAGIGVVENDSVVERTNQTTGAVAIADGSEIGLAWSLLAGVRWDVAERWTLKLGYRYSELGEIRSGAFADGAVHRADDHYAHDVRIGLQYRF